MIAQHQAIFSALASVDTTLARLETQTGRQLEWQIYKLQQKHLGVSGSNQFRGRPREGGPQEAPESSMDQERAVLLRRRSAAIVPYQGLDFHACVSVGS